MKENKLTSHREELAQMSTGTLDELLLAELKKEDPDGELVRSVLAELEEREADYPVEINAEVKTAWEKYQTYSVDELTPVKPIRKSGRFLKVASVVLVIGILFFVIPQVAQAENFFDRLARWTDSIFEFFNPEDDEDPKKEYVFQTDNPGLQQVYDAVVELGVTDPVVPMWIPEGYELVECRTISTPTESYVHARFISAGSTLVYEMKICASEIIKEYYKNEDEVDMCEIDGTIHYVLQNIDKRTALWTKDNIECSMSVDCQEDVFYKILNTIYTTEDI